MIHDSMVFLSYSYAGSSLAQIAPVVTALITAQYSQSLLNANPNILLLREAGNGWYSGSRHNMHYKILELRLSATSSGDLRE
jgi:hypothetical protein